MAHDDSLAAFHAAAGTGELLTVRYHGGRHPGAKRRIVILSYDEDVLLVRVPPSTEPKTYFASQTEVCADDYPAPWAPAEGRVKWKRIDATAHFSDWHFKISKAHYPALGVMLRVPPKEAPYYARSEPLQLDFHDGDTFAARSHAALLQVMCLWTTHDGVDMLEAHRVFNGQRHAYHLPCPDFATWLQHGLPESAVPIPQRESRREVLRPFISAP